MAAGQRAVDWLAQARRLENHLRTLVLPYWRDASEPPLDAIYVPGHRSILDTSKAERLLGWKAEHPWRDLGGR
jgi:hypothetical protein